MRRGYRYSDAVRLLGGQDPAIKALDTLLGVGTLGVWDLIEAKNELTKVGNDLLSRWKDWRAGRQWRSRTERIEAAHTILVVTAFSEVVQETQLPFSVRDLELSHNGQEIAHTRIKPVGRTEREQARELVVPVCPSPEQPFEETLNIIQSYYQSLSRVLMVFVRGTSVWQGLNGAEQERTSRALGHHLVLRATQRYSDRYRSLSVDVPEFALWASMVEHQATRVGLAELGRLVSMVASTEILPDQLTTFQRLNSAVLTRPVAQTGDLPDGLGVPTLESAYVTPCFRIAEADKGDDPTLEGWWQKPRIRTDLPGYIAGFLTSPMAATVPLMVLGQPGAGKSVLTKMLAARLSESSFLPIRVPLREVSATVEVQEQVEQAICQQSGERMAWPALSRSAATAGALPVIMLDGFDELLQATGVRHSDYLAKVALFQRREADMGRAVAVIVTSRTAVANLARFPDTAMVARLEPFQPHQIRAWLDVWNATNAEYFGKAALAPFEVGVALSQKHLAEQPLLLLMLALYDADGNELRKNLETMGRAELYERLMKTFAERELEKSLPRDLVPGRVEAELLRLSVVAFAMFNRGRQWATGKEVDEDLVTLVGRQTRDSTFAAPLSAGQEAFGRFFFVHRAQAMRDEEKLCTYEFLHATFGEFLIARLIASLMRELVTQESRLRLTGPNDGLLRTLLSWATVSSRVAVVMFLRELADVPAQWQEVAMRLFRELDQRDNLTIPGYRPQNPSQRRKDAHYLANLLILALTWSNGSLWASDLMPEHESVVAAWQSHATLWWSQCKETEWDSLVDMIKVGLAEGPEGKRDVGVHLSKVLAAVNPSGDGEVTWDSRSSLERSLMFCCRADRP
ncbi:NACHT domain-containing protein [Nonomuraea sp. NPDC050790]|uniref:NACHT domain-containing protein n=1 Tax=Nonomuraea sp. NPDC050790 TaxID=3364371 RepID=UPI003795F699